MKTLLLSLLSLALFAGCAPARPSAADISARHRLSIAHTLGATQINEVSAPSGPFHLSRVGHQYYRAYVLSTKRTYYVDAYVSMWSLATAAAGSSDPIYRYSYYQQMPFGLYVPIMR